MAWEKLFHVPVLNWLIRQYGAFPVKLKSADKSAVAESLRILKNHEALIVFPEGERGASGSLQEFEKGVARVAMQTGAAIVPVTITGAYEAFSRKHHLPHWFKRITIKFHPAIHVAASDSREGLREKIEKLNDAIACPIRRRLNAYNRLRKKQQS
jgi:1-acyl-sn-glycerol-3-phosphate acyltransferase